MERVVKIAEIATMIIQYVHDENSQDTHSCALVCKLWSGIALDLLWRVIPTRNRESVSVKLCVLLPFFDDKAETENGVSKLEVIQNNSESLDTSQNTWTRFVAYSSRVRCLHVIPDSDEVKPPIDDFTNLDRLYPFPLIFPNLKSLQVPVLPDKDGSLAYIARYFCDSLQKVMMFFEVPDQSRALGLQPSTPPKNDKLLRQLSDKSIRIKELHLICPPPQARDVPERTLLDILPKFQYLETLHLEDNMLSLPILTSISRLPKFTTLDAYLFFRTRRPWLYFSPIDSNRRQASYEGTSANGPLFPLMWVFTAFLQFMDVAALHSGSTFAPLSQIQNLRVVNTDARAGYTMTELLSNIAQSFMNLKVLRIEHPCESLRIDVDLSARPFAVLQQLPQLTAFELLSDASTSISDDDLASLVKWIPSLMFLRIGAASFRSPKHNFTLKSLSVLSHQPNKLRVLHLQTDLPLRSDLFCFAAKTKEEPGMFLKELEECEFGGYRREWDRFADEELVGVREFLDKCLSKERAKHVFRQIDASVAINI